MASSSAGPQNPAGSSPEAGEDDLKVNWPYKHLWNVLRGASILADDDVVLGELRVSYEKIVLGLTQFPPRKEEDVKKTAPVPATPATVGVDAATAATSGTSNAAPDPKTPLIEGTGEVPGVDNEKKLRKRISVELNLEEDVAWSVFCSYMMFEYKGGSTSFEKLLESPRVSTDFLTDLKLYYENERLSVLLVIQAIFGFAGQPEHKYNHIFQAVCDWVKTEETSVLCENLIKSLSLVKNAQEEVQVLHALTLFIYHMPYKGVEDFCNKFQFFSPGRKDIKILMAEAALIFTLANFPLLLDAEEDVPQSMRSAVENFLETKGDDLLMNDYNLGSVLSGFLAVCPRNHRVKQILAHPKHEFQSAFRTMLQLAEVYSEDSVENSRNSLSTVVLKSLLFALRAISEGFGVQRIFRCGSKSDFYDLAAALMDHSEVAALLCSDEDSVLQVTVYSAMTDFPLKLKHITNIWGSLCSAHARFPNQSIPLLKDCCKMVTILAEATHNSDTIKEVMELNVNGYRLVEPRVVAGVKLPPGTELDHIDEEEDGSCCTFYWRIPQDLVLDVFSVINKELLIPVATNLQTASLGHAFAGNAIQWVNDPNENILSVLKFLIKYASCSSAITGTLMQQYEPMAFIVFKTIDYINQWKLKSELCCYLIELLAAANKFGPQKWSHKYFNEVWPARLESSSFVSDIIMGHESVANNECIVTIAFLKSVLTFFKTGAENTDFANDVEESVAYNSVDFVNENVFHSFTRWRFSTVEAKYKILLNCLKMYRCVFDVKSSSWKPLKDACAQCLLVPNSSIMSVLSETEENLQLSVLHPTRENCLLPEIIYQSLGVLLKLFLFQHESIKLVDSTLGSTLVQKLARFARHRLDYKIPTLAMALLKKIAEEIQMSLLSCLGSEDVAFRDLISQRLEFRSEDVNLKVAILDFLTVAAHTQPGLIQYVFMDDYLAQKIVDLPTEKDEGLALAVLCFLRALFRKGATVMKKCQNLWDNVFHPVNQLQPGGRLKILTCTLNIATLELFRYGIANTKFATHVRTLLKEDNLLRLFEMPLRAPPGPLRSKCVLAFKHFLVVVLHRNDLEDCFDVEVRKHLLDFATSHYWTMREDEVVDPQFSKAMLDIMCQLMSSVSSEPEYVNEYLENLASRLSKNFLEDGNILLQNGGLTLAAICMKKSSAAQITDVVLEHLFRVIGIVYENAYKIFRHMGERRAELDNISSLISLTSSIILIVIQTVNPNVWQKLFHRFTIPNALVHATNEGINNCRQEKVVMELLFVLLKMSEVKECAEALISGMIVPKVLLPVMRNAERNVEESADGSSLQWTKIYLITLQLMTQLLRTEQIFFVENCLNLWGSHGTHIVDQLNSLPSMTSACKLNQHEYNLKMMKGLLTFNVYVLDAITAMIPFWKQWTLNNSYEHLRILDAVFTAMQTSVNLLDQPQYLQSFITVYHGSLLSNKLPSIVEMRPTPQLLDLHTKLWDIIHLSTFLFWSLRTWTNDVIESPKIMAASNQIAQSCIKALSKPDRRSHSSGSHSPTRHSVSPSLLSKRIQDTLERTMSLYLFHGKRTLEHPLLTEKQRQNVLREIAIDAGTLCDGVRRVPPSHQSELLEKLCNCFETTFNVVPSVHAFSRIVEDLHEGNQTKARADTSTVDSVNSQIRSLHRPEFGNRHPSQLQNHPVFRLGMDTPQTLKRKSAARGGGTQWDF